LTASREAVATCWPSAAAGPDKVTITPILSFFLRDGMPRREAHSAASPANLN